MIRANVVVDVELKVAFEFSRQFAFCLGAE